MKRTSAMESWQLCLESINNEEASCKALVEVSKLQELAIPLYEKSAKYEHLRLTALQVF